MFASVWQIITLMLTIHSPVNAKRVLCIDAEARTAYPVGPDLDLGNESLMGGVVQGPDALFMIRKFDHHRSQTDTMTTKYHGTILKCVPPLQQRERVSLVDALLKGFEHWWSGGAMGPDNMIYYVPGGADQV